MKGKVVMVTGASAGMGREISLELARSGASVVMVCRDPGRGGAALRYARSASGSDAVEMLLADLASQESIRALAQDFVAKHDRLDVLVNNVGVTVPKRTETVDGIETVFATNHLAPFLRTNLLLPVLKARAPSRLVTLSSRVQAVARLSPAHLDGKNGYRGIDRHNQSELPDRPP